MLEAVSTRSKRNRTFILLGVCAALGLAAAAIGIDDNLAGILFAYLAAIALVASLVHPWQTFRRYRRLLYLSILAIVVAVLLHNLLDFFASNVGGVGSDLLGGAAAAFFIVGTLLAPAGVLVGGIGALVMFLRERDEHHGASAPQ